MAETSAAFERFRFSFFEDADSARQGLDTKALGELVGQERARAEAMLIDFLPDSRAVIGLGVLRSRRAESSLSRLFEAERLAQSAANLLPDAGWFSSRLLSLASALWQIRPDARWAAAVVEILDSAQEPMARQEAAEALYDVRDRAAVPALAKALEDPEPLVRYHAGRGLLAIHGLSADSGDPQHMLYRVMADETSRREGGKRDILAAIGAAPISS